jgi:predicted permease
MRKLRSLWIRFIGIFGSGQAAPEVDAELESHLQMHIDDNLRAGMSAGEARRRALIQLGGLEQTRQAVHERSTLPWIENLAQDVRFALRQIRRSPGFALAAVTLLALGLGSVTTVFSLIDAILLKPLPYSEPMGLVIPWNVPPPGVSIGGFADFPWSPIHFHALEQDTQTYRYLGAFQEADFNLTEAGEPELLEGAQVSWGFFPALGVQPELGRFFTRDEDTPGRNHEVVLSNALWRSRFHADPSVVNRTIRLNGMSYLVVGVMPRGFGFPRSNEMPADFDFPRETVVWVPIALPAITPKYTPSELAFIGRLQPGVSVAQAQAQMNMFAERMDRLHPEMKGWSASHVTPLQRQVAGDTQKPLLLILAAVGVVLLIVCFNVAGLLLTRSLGRQREFTLRAALGAGRERMLRQLLTENLLLAVAGGTLGMGLAAAGIWLVKTFGPANLPRLQEAGPDLRIFAFACGATLLTGLLFGIAPAIGAARVNLVESLKDGGQKSGSGSCRPRLRSALVISQTALALVLVIAAGLLVRTVSRLLASDSGFRAGHVLTFELSLPSTEFPDRDHIARFYQQALPSLRAVAGVESAAVGEVVPMGGSTESTMIRIQDRPAPKDRRYPIVNYTVVSPNYFATLGTPLLQGRDVLDSDLLSSPPVTVINRSMAQEYWPGESPIGKRVLVPSQRIPATIVGVVADMKHTSLREAPTPEMFEPYTQNVWPSLALMQVVLRTRADPDSVIAGVRTALQLLDPGLPLAKISTLTALTSDAVAQERFSMLLLGFFGTLALLLAAVGIYGVISYSVGQQTREIGIRMALGAPRSQVFGAILRRSLSLALLGIGAGVIVALCVGRVFASYLYGVKAWDPLTFLAVALFLAITALLAGYLPARRAASVDPMQALRSE